jgi:hypothetical protein
VLEFALGALCPFFLHFLPLCNIFLHLWLFFAIGSIHQEAQAKNPIAIVLQASQTGVVFYQFSSSIVSCTSGLLRIQLSSSIFSSSIVTVLPDYSGYNCFLVLFFKFYGFFFGVFIWLSTFNYLA